MGAPAGDRAVSKQRQPFTLEGFNRAHAVRITVAGRGGSDVVTGPAALCLECGRRWVSYNNGTADTCGGRRDCRRCSPTKKREVKR